jgi:hypothetical protein
MIESADLTAEELAALRGAATWYANYHAREIDADAHETAAYAVEDRRRYLALLSALRKLGVQIPLPDQLAAVQRQAA